MDSELLAELDKIASGEGVIRNDGEAPCCISDYQMAEIFRTLKRVKGVPMDSMACGDQFDILSRHPPIPR